MIETVVTTLWAAIVVMIIGLAYPKPCPPPPVQLRKEEEKMAKKKTTVKFARTDAPKPKKMPSGLIGICAPIPMTLRPNQRIDIDLGLKCDHALVLVPGKVNPDRVVVAPGAPLTLEKAFASVTEETPLEVGDVLFTACPLVLVAGDEYEVE